MLNVFCKIRFDFKVTSGTVNYLKKITMKIVKTIINNFRSIKFTEFTLNDYSLLIGENNAGKSNILKAIRAFYGEYNFNASTDKYKIVENCIDDSWIELWYKLTDNEHEGLKEEYKNGEKVLKIRRYLDGERYKKNQSNLYVIIEGKISTNNFYGTKNVSESKIGRIIYIPELAKAEDTLKLTGQSAFKDILGFVTEKFIKNSSSFQNLNEQVKALTQKIKEERAGKYSFHQLSSDINKELEQWGINLDFNFKHISEDVLLKNLLSYDFIDKLNNTDNNTIDSFGQGFQRHLIYTLILLSVKYTDRTVLEKKDFNPEFILILFEEPEAFLHPSQQESLHIGLNSLSQYDNQQVLITTHSPIFVSKNTENLSSLVKISKLKESKAFQLSQETFKNLCEQNIAIPTPQMDQNREISLSREAFRMFLWLDSERSSLFFAKQVLICEGATEKILFEYLCSTEWQEYKNKHIYFLDAMGKYNIHRYMNLFKELGIRHSVVFDKDTGNKSYDTNHKPLNEFIYTCSNEFTIKIDTFDNDIEDFLGVKSPTKEEIKRGLKPICLLMNYKDGKIKSDKIAQLKTFFNNILAE